MGTNARDKQRALGRRQLLTAAAAAVAAAGIPAKSTIGAEARHGFNLGPRPGNPIAVSTYSFWRFQDNAKLPIETCIRLAAEMGFDAVEILEMQMDKTDHGYLQTLKREAFLCGLSLCGLSTHQGFVSPDAEKRKANIAKTIASIELAYQLGIPTMRVNTGRWGTSKNFDELMKNRGIEPPLPGYTDEDAFPWVIESLEECLPTAEKCGVVLGLENHWGLGRTPEGVLRIVNAVNSPWLRVTLDTGNFLEDPYDRLAMLAATDGLCPSQDLLRRRNLVLAGPRLSAHRRHPAPAQIPRLHFAGVRGPRGLPDGAAEESGRAAKCVHLLKCSHSAAASICASGSSTPILARSVVREMPQRWLLSAWS